MASAKPRSSTTFVAIGSGVSSTQTSVRRLRRSNIGSVGLRERAHGVAPRPLGISARYPHGTFACATSFPPAMLGILPCAVAVPVLLGASGSSARAAITGSAKRRENEQEPLHRRPSLFAAGRRHNPCSIRVSDGNGSGARRAGSSRHYWKTTVAVLQADPSVRARPVAVGASSAPRHPGQVRPWCDLCIFAGG